MIDGDDGLRGHFLPPFFLIGSASRSPYQTTLEPRSSTVPNTTGIGRPSSAVGASTSDRDAGLGSGGFGASATETSAATTMTTRYHMAISPGIQNTPVENGFLLGMAGKPP
ncbi:Uncharacterized conserved protein [Janthinobacterium sp. Marseille]|nr:Uncharacterized conserved protein [Janthinobacterium sp. Marseille]